MASAPQEEKEEEAEEEIYDLCESVSAYVVTLPTSPTSKTVSLSSYTQRMTLLDRYLCTTHLLYSITFNGSGLPFQVLCLRLSILRYSVFIVFVVGKGFPT